MYGNRPPLPLRAGAFWFLPMTSFLTVSTVNNWISSSKVFRSNFPRRDLTASQFAGLLSLTPAAQKASDGLLADFYPNVFRP